MSTLQFTNSPPFSASLSASPSPLPLFLAPNLRLPTKSRASFALTTVYKNRKIQSLKNPRLFRICCSAGVCVAHEWVINYLFSWGIDGFCVNGRSLIHKQWLKRIVYLLFCWQEERAKEWV